MTLSLDNPSSEEKFSKPEVQIPGGPNLYDLNREGLMPKDFIEEHRVKGEKNIGLVLKSAVPKIKSALKGQGFSTDDYSVENIEEGDLFFVKCDDQTYNNLIKLAKSINAGEITKKKHRDT